jgi:hypothetical protein
VSGGKGSGHGTGYDVPGFKPLHKGRLREGIARVYADAGSLPTPMVNQHGEPVLNAAGRQKWHVNPSLLGFTWAWVLVDEHDQLVRKQYGYEVCPIVVDGRTWACQTDLGEFYALMRALAHLPEGWSGEVATDNLLTIHRMFHQQPTRSIPPKWVKIAAKLRADLMGNGGLLVPIHLRGHPTRDQLLLGHDGTEGRPGIPVSRWNVEVDSLTRLARARAEEYINNGREQAKAKAGSSQGGSFEGDLPGCEPTGGATVPTTDDSVYV